MTNKDFILAVDLYIIRYLEKHSDWYELFDVIRDYLLNKGHTVTYTKDDVIFNDISIKNIINKNDIKTINNERR